MNIIKHATQPVQPTATRYRAEERTIDVPTYDLDDLEKSVVDTYDRVGLVNATTGVTRVLTARDQATGWDLFRQQLAHNPDRYASGTGRRLVLVGGDR